MHNISMWFAERGKEKALAEQKAALAQQCDEDKRLTKEASHEYQAKTADLDRLIADAMAWSGGRNGTYTLSQGTHVTTPIRMRQTSAFRFRRRP